MAQFRLPLLRAARRPLLAAWLLFFAFAGVSALLLQLVVLPLWFPALHAGNGLLVGGDWVGFHKIAVTLSEKMKLLGWGAWELSPLGHTPAGIAAIFYTIFAPHPYVLIPLNAAMHATAGVMLMQLIRLLTADDVVAFLAALPFVLFPSAMAWYAQLGKDGFYFAGAFLCIYGWVLIARVATWRFGSWSVLQGTIWLGAGLLLMAAVRTYAFQLMQGIGILIACALTILFVVRGLKAVLSWNKCFTAIAILWVIPVILQFAPRETRGSTEVFQSGEASSTLSWHGADFAKEKWQVTPGLPRFIENAFLRIAVLRHGYFVTPGYSASGSMVDRDIDLIRVKDFYTYLPRALQLGFLAPFPSAWLDSAHSGGGTIMRRVSGVEMLAVYLALLFLPYAMWRWRSRVEMWLPAAVCTILLLMYAYATPNIGSLYRLRYGFLMLLATVGVASALAAWRSLSNFPANIAHPNPDLK